MIKFLSLSAMFAYLQLLRTCVGVYSMYVHAYLLPLIPSSEMQQPSKSQFRKLLCLIHITLLHLHKQWFRCMSLIIYQADYTRAATNISLNFLPEAKTKTLLRDVTLKAKASYIQQKYKCSGFVFTHIFHEVKLKS